MALKPIPIEERQGTLEERTRAYNEDMAHAEANPGAWGVQDRPALPAQPGDALKLSMQERKELEAFRAQTQTKQLSDDERAELEKLRAAQQQAPTRTQAILDAIKRLKEAKVEGTLKQDGEPRLDALKTASGLPDLTVDEVALAMEHGS